MTRNLTPSEAKRRQDIANAINNEMSEAVHFFPPPPAMNERLKTKYGITISETFLREMYIQLGITRDFRGVYRKEE